jgi:peptidoglycan/LPS O-acetylase OafA/YrhL
LAEQTAASAPFRQVDPLIAAPPRPVAAEAFTIPPIGFRPDIEGLRAIAVALVVLFHAEIGPFSGGFIGVDVFFVVSGFLITSLLLGEVARTGTVRLPNFWARRARRLLPASCLVIVATLIAAQWLYDPLLLGELARDAVATCGFFVNYVFAWRESHGDGGYFDAEIAKSPLLHFWSLAVEEQFYLLWPLLIWTLARFARRLRHELTIVIIGLWVLSFGACLWLTDNDRPWAFYSLGSRAWELLTGALLAISIASLRMLPRRFVLPMAVGGLAVVIVAAMRFDATTAFPGYAAAAPVFGTALVIAAGCSVEAPAAIRNVLGSRPMLWVGQRSYAIYLWHWPALVFAGYTWGPLSTAQALLVVAIAIVLSAVSYRFVEDPVRHSPWMASRPSRSLTTGFSMLLVTSLVAGLLLANPRAESAGGEAATLTLPSAGLGAPSASTEPAPTTAVPTTAASTVVDPTAAASSAATTAAATTTTTIGAPPTTPVPAGPTLADLIALQQGNLEQGLTTQEVPSNLHPSLSTVRGDLPAIYDHGCVLDPGQPHPPDCVYGNPAGAVTVAILGDSHAAHWYPALEAIATAHDWRLLYFSKKGCPPSEQPLRNALANRECNPWRDEALAKIIAARPNLIILTGYHYATASGGVGDDIWRDGMTTTLTKLGDLAPNVVILGDTPTENADVPQCLSGHLRSVPACVSPRSYSVRSPRLQVEAELAAQFGTATIDTSDWLCTQRACPVIIGDLLVYRDRNHLTPDASMSLAPLLEAAIVPLIK